VTRNATGRTRRRILAGGAAGGAAAIAIVGCGAAGGADGAAPGSGGSGGSGGNAADRPPVRIGASATGTGSALQRGYELWAEQTTRRGGLLGRPVALTIYDDQSDPTNGTKLYEKLIAEDKVDLVLSPSVSSVTLAASTVIEKNKVPMIAAGAATADIWKRNYKYIFGMYSVAEAYFNGLIDLALKNNLKRIAIVNEDTVFPNATAGGAAQYARSKGAELVFQQKYAPRAVDVSALLGRLKAAAPDVVLAGSYEPDALLIARQMKEQDVAVKVLAFSIGATSAGFASAAGPAAEGVFGPSMWEPDLKTPGNREFVDSFKAKWGSDADSHAATAYAAGQVLEAAVKKVNGLDREKLRDALASLDTTTILPGKFKVDDTGAQTGHVPVIFQWQGGQKVIVGPDGMATGRAKL
jgi:branched-chain amino acid transport system substrate-binding protein